jgi:hypothetical protein
MTSDILTAPKELTDRSDRRTGPAVAELAAYKPQHGRASSARWLSPSTARPCERPQAARSTQGGVRIPADSEQ